MVLSYFRILTQYQQLPVVIQSVDQLGNILEKNITEPIEPFLSQLVKIPWKFKSILNSNGELWPLGDDIPMISGQYDSL